MIKVKVGSQLKEVIRLAFAAGRAVMLVGTTGIGKSESIDQVARELGLICIVRDLSLMEPPDLAGLPQIVGGKMRFIPPAFLPNDGKGVLVFEELNRAMRHTRTPCLQLLTAGVLNDYRLPTGWLLAACINPAEEGYDVDELDKALLARFLIIHVAPCVKSWIEWAKRNAIHGSVIQFVEDTPKIFEPNVSNPRSWKYVSDILKGYEQGEFKREALLASIAGFVGDKLANAFLRVYTGAETFSVPSPKQIISTYGRVRKTVKDLASAGNVASLNSLCDKLLLHLQEPTNERAVKAKPKWISNLRALLSDLPAEFKTRMLKHHKWLAN